MNRRGWIIGGSVAAIAAAGLWWGLQDKPAPTAPAASVAASQPGDTIPLSAEQIKALGIRLAQAEPATTMAVAELPARIVPPANARVAVAAQFPGVITRVYVVDGQEVRAGQALASVVSRDMVSLNAELARARSRQTVARAQAARLGQLAREGIIAPARADEAAAIARQSAIDVGEQSRLIGLANGARAGGAGYMLTAPIGGRISSMTAETGKPVDTGMAPFVVDGGGPLQVVAQLPERLIGTVRPGMKLRIGSADEGEVIAVGSTIDPMTRSATVTGTIPPGSGISGGSATAVIEGPAPAGAVRIPATALARIDGRPVVFVVVRGGVRLRPVMVVSEGAEVAIVTQGLQPGERIVAAGTSELSMLAGAN